MDITPVIASIMLLAFSIPSVAKLSRYRGVKSTVVNAMVTICTVLAVILIFGLVLGAAALPWIFRWTVPVVLLAVWVVLALRVADCQGGKAGVNPLDSP
jgi:fatty acid desaturase